MIVHTIPDFTPEEVGCLRACLIARIDERRDVLLREVRLAHSTDFSGLDALFGDFKFHLRLIEKIDACCSFEPDVIEVSDEF